MDLIDIEQQPTCSNKEWKTSYDDLNKLMFELKEKFRETTIHGDKVQILTLKPSSWSIHETAKFFDCPISTVRQALKLKSDHGLLSKPPVRSARQGISDTVKDQVLAFYEDDEFSRLMPGSGDYVSLKSTGKSDFFSAI